MRVSSFFICFNQMLNLSFIEDQYFVNTAFIYNSQFEGVLSKYNANISQGKLDSVAWFHMNE